jgi:hypothetical protein
VDVNLYDLLCLCEPELLCQFEPDLLCQCEPDLLCRCKSETGTCMICFPELKLLEFRNLK